MMKIRNHLIAAAAVAAALVGALGLPLVAQTSGAGEDDDARRHHGRHGLHGRVTEYLALTEQQQASVKQLKEELRERVRPLREEQRAAREQLRTALEAANPDPTAVGRLVIAMEGKRDEIRAIHQEYQRDFAALLTAEQREKYDSLKETRSFFHERRGHRGYRGHRGAR
jgi:Spy/CpxP family protein refolding chaperone